MRTFWLVSSAQTSAPLCHASLFSLLVLHGGWGHWQVLAGVEWRGPLPSCGRGPIDVAQQKVEGAVEGVAVAAGGDVGARQQPDEEREQQGH